VLDEDPAPLCERGTAARSVRPMSIVATVAHLSYNGNVQSCNHFPTRANTTASVFKLSKPPVAENSKLLRSEDNGGMPLQTGRREICLVCRH